MDVLMVMEPSIGMVNSVLKENMWIIKKMEKDVFPLMTKIIWKEYSYVIEKMGYFRQLKLIKKNRYLWTNKLFIIMN